MKKIFVIPAIEAVELSAESEVMGVFSVASSVGQSAQNTIVIKDDKSKADDGSFDYWCAK